MLRIGHFAANMMAKGGISTYIQRLASAQRGRGSHVTLISNAIESEYGQEVHSTVDLFEVCRQNNLDILHLHTRISTLPEPDISVVRTVHTNSGGCPSGSRYLTSKNSPCDRKFGLVGCTWGHLVNHCGSRKPSRITHGFRNTRSEIEHSRRILTIAVSEYVRGEMIRAGCPPNNVHVLRSPAPVNDNPFCESDDGDVVRLVFFGRIVSHKGLDWLVRALATCPSNVVLDVAGDGNPREIADVKALAVSLGIAERIHWHGWIDPAEVTVLIKAARAVVFPSVWHEPAGLVTLEAAAYGRPVIASKVGGIPEYGLPEFARLVSPHDVEALANAIVDLAVDHRHANEMGSRGYQLAKGIFSMESFLEKQDELYDLARRVADEN